MDDFVAKPVDVAALRRALEQWVAADPETVAAPSSAAEPGPSTVLDQEQLAALRSVGAPDGWGVLPAYVGIFTAAAAERGARLRGCHDAGDTAGLADAVHELRGAAATLGLADLAQRCGALETGLRSGGACTPDELAGVEQALEDGCSALDRLVDGRSARA